MKKEKYNPFLSAKALSAACGVRKNLAWLDWLISEINREVEIAEVREFGITKTEINLYLTISVPRSTKRRIISVHILGDRNFYIQEYDLKAEGGGTIRVIGSGHLYGKNLIFPKKYVKKELARRS